MFSRFAPTPSGVWAFSHRSVILCASVSFPIAPIYLHGRSVRHAKPSQKPSSSACLAVHHGAGLSPRAFQPAGGIVAQGSRSSAGLPGGRRPQAARSSTIANSGQAADRLALRVQPGRQDRRAARDRGRVDGVMKMVHHPEGWEIPAGGTLELKPGGKHIMLIGLTAPLEAGRSDPDDPELRESWGTDDRRACAGHGRHVAATGWLSCASAPGSACSPVVARQRAGRGGLAAVPTALGSNVFPSWKALRTPQRAGLRPDHAPAAYGAAAEVRGTPCHEPDRRR